MLANFISLFSVDLNFIFKLAIWLGRVRLIRSIFGYSIGPIVSNRYYAYKELQIYLEIFFLLFIERCSSSTSLVIRYRRNKQIVIN